MSDLASVEGLPQWHPPIRVLEFAELVLNGVLAQLPDGLPRPPERGPVVLEDAEGTPVAVWNPESDHLSPVRPFSQGPLRGARATPEQVHSRLAEIGGAHDVLAVPLSGSVTTGAVKAIESQAAGRPILWMAVVGDGRTRDLPPLALWRAVRALARESGVAVPLVLPHAQQPDQEMIDQAALAYGASEVWTGDAAQAGLSRPGSMHQVFEQEWHRMASPGRYPGATIFFTGLSGSGKSTVAKALADRISEGDGEFPGRVVSLLDGDEVRRMLSAGLGFSRADRDLNILRIGYVAAEITRHGGLAICAPIAPFDATRQRVRERVSAVGTFVLIHVNTPLAECERRDRKGLYAKARAGEIPEFTGISSPYEEPMDADLRLDTSVITLEESVDQVYALVQERGLLTTAR
jgi:sulfate adenylyltransferase